MVFKFYAGIDEKGDGLPEQPITFGKPVTQEVVVNLIAKACGGTSKMVTGVFSNLRKFEEATDNLILREAEDYGRRCLSVTAYDSDNNPLHTFKVDSKTGQKCSGTEEILIKGDQLELL